MKKSSPFFIYFFIFVILTWPLILKFSTHFFSDAGDGLLNVWNIWWVNKAVTGLHQSPWHTYYLHYPHGVPLIGHTLTPFNGFMGIFLLKFLTMVETYNFVVIFSFVVAGVTGFWLAYYFTRSYWGSIIAGFIFTFSNYHFAHAEGHLNLVALEWIPLFVLCWYIFIARPGIFLALASGILLFLVFLCDYYYFFYCILTGCLVGIWHALKERDLFFLFRKRRLIPLAVFILAVIAVTGPLIASLLFLNMRDPLWGSHPVDMYSMDILAPFIYGGHWRFARLTEFYWSKLPVSINETSVHTGISVLFLLIYVWVKRRKLRLDGLGLWYSLLIFFFVMSLGPILHIWGIEIPFVRLPYALLKEAFPSLKFSSVPVRIIGMAMLIGISFFTVKYIRARRRELRSENLRLLHLVLIFLAIMNLDAALLMWGRGALFIKLPYALMEKLFPFLKLSGVPMRMMVMVMLSASVICAAGFKTLFKTPGGKVVSLILLVMLFLEYMPRPMPATRIHMPGYIEILKDSANGRGVIDTVTRLNLAAYYQTIHEKPIAFSDVARIPKSVLEKDNELRELLQKRDFGRLYHDYNFKYLIAGADAGILDDDQSIKMIYNDGKVRLYDLGAKEK